jgi:predicted MPP superfamily phosphohydrolase
MRPVRAALLAAAGGAGYAVWEAHAYRTGEIQVPLSPDVPELTILHISDTHMTASKRKMAGFLEDLPDELDGPPDLVIATGDMIDDDTGIDPLVKSLSGVRARLGRFYVLGSHDYFQSTVRGFVNGLKKFYSGPRQPLRTKRADVERLEEGLRSDGWVSLSNATEFVTSGSQRVRITGMDDPVLGRHRSDHLGRGPDDALAIGVLHTPELLSLWANKGYDLVLAGHTHGGQVRVPFVGALVTNCSLPAALARGLHRVGGTWVHVSPGLGTSKFSRIRFLCRPEVTLLRLGSG